MPELPTGTVTFLFTDLVASTRLWEEQPDAMKSALARHDAILREAITAHDGHVVKMRGDGAHAAFADATNAVHAARDAQGALAAEDWGPVGELRVRIGIHTGPAQARDGDYFGSAVNRAARLMNAAHSGQIVVSLATEELARDALSDDVELVDLGEHQLRDLSRPERIFEVRAPHSRAVSRDYRRSTPIRGAKDALRNAFQHFADIGDRPQLIGSLSRCVRVLLRAGDAETAAVLVGVMNDGPLAELNNFPGSRFAADHPRLAELEARLGADRYREARAVGANLSFDEVVEVVLGSLDRLEVPHE